MIKEKKDIYIVYFIMIVHLLRKVFTIRSVRKRLI